MFILGHMGVTLAVPYLAGEKGLGRLRRHSPLPIDYRLVLLGSMLPDIIDKTLGIGLFPRDIGNGRIIAHTLAFHFTLLTAGVLCWRLGVGGGVLTLALSSAGHLVLDRMWLTPATLFWPAHGWGFPHSSVEGWLWSLLRVLFSWPELHLSELIGAAVLLSFFLELWRRGRLWAFLKTGRSG